MYIIFGTEVADEIRQKHVVLELEVFVVDDKAQTAYCVVQPESIALTEMGDIDRLQRIHQALVDALKRKDYTTVTEGITHLRGKFGGELDSFYDILTERIRIANGETVGG